MKENDILNVWYKDQLVGEICQDFTGAIGFRYNKNWGATGFSISQKLPLGTDEFPPESRIAHRFFVNLLPEEGAMLLRFKYQDHPIFTSKEPKQKNHANEKLPETIVSVN